MKITITSRHVVVNDVVKTYAHDKLERLSKYFDGVTTAEVVFSSQGERYEVEAIVQTRKGAKFIGHAADKDFCIAIDSVIDKLEKQLRRFKERLCSKKKSTTRLSRTVMSGGAGNEQEPLQKGDSSGDIWW